MCTYLIIFHSNIAPECLFHSLKLIFVTVSAPSSSAHSARLLLAYSHLHERAQNMIRITQEISMLFGFCDFKFPCILFLGLTLYKWSTFLLYEKEDRFVDSFLLALQIILYNVILKGTASEVHEAIKGEVNLLAENEVQAAFSLHSVERMSFCLFFPNFKLITDCHLLFSLCYQEGYQPIHLAVWRKETSEKDAIIKVLLESGCDPNGRTAIVSILQINTWQFIM